MTRTLLKSVQSATILSLGIIFGSCEAVDTTPPEFTSQVKIEQNPNPSAPLAGVLSFSTDEPVTTTIQVSDGKNEWTLEYDQTKNTQQGLPVIGMRADRQHTISVIVQDNAGNETSIEEPLSFATPPLPEGTDKFPPLDVTVQKQRKWNRELPYLVFVVTKPIRVIWYKETRKLKLSTSNLECFWLLIIKGNQSGIMSRILASVTLKFSKMAILFT